MLKAKSNNEINYLAELGDSAPYIKEIKVRYAVSNSGTVAPASFSNDYQNMTPTRPYLWIHEQYIFSDEKIIENTRVAGRMGLNGTPPLAPFIRINDCMSPITQDTGDNVVFALGQGTMPMIYDNAQGMYASVSSVESFTINQQNFIRLYYYAKGSLTEETLEIPTTGRFS